MKRSVGVTVIAILSIVGSLFTFAVGILVVLAMILAPAPPSNQFPGSPIFFKVILSAVSLMYVLPAVWGVLTGIGLWRLKNWARISMIVFSALLILMGGFSGSLSLVVPIPATPNNAVHSSLMANVRILMGVFWLTLMGIGIWWLVFFSRSKVKRQFGQLPQVIGSGSTQQTAYPVQSAPLSTTTPSVAERPLSIMILAWLLLVGSLFIPLNLVLHLPAILFTRLVTGWPAVLFYVTYAAVQLCIGVGLLRLRPAARTAAITYFAFGLVNAAVFYFAPGGHSRALALMENQRSMFPWMRPFVNQPELHFDPTPLLVVGAIAGLVFCTVPLYFLITRKVAFEQAAADLESGPR